MFQIQNSTIINSLFSFLVFLLVNVFVDEHKYLSNECQRKHFVLCFYITRALISGLALSPVKLFNTLLSDFCSFGSVSTSFKVAFSKFASKLEHYYVSLLRSRLFCGSLNMLPHNFGHTGIGSAFILTL